MTVKQRLLKIVYPLFISVVNLTSKTNFLENKNAVAPLVPIYSIKTTLSDGAHFSFENLKGKKILIVNTASDCGYTAQYNELQKLQEKYKNELVVIAFPSNDFKQQEKGTNEEITAFCKINYGVTFPIVKKSEVKGDNKNDIFNWLSDKKMNGWNTKEPTWNFSKYLINEEGVLTHYFHPAVSPLSSKVVEAVEK